MRIRRVCGLDPMRIRLVGRSKAEKIRELQEDLFTVVEVVAGAGRCGIVGIAGAAQSAVAKRSIEILKIVVIADVEYGARMREPGEECLGTDLFPALQGCLRGVCKG